MTNEGKERSMSRELRDWVKERIANCERIAASKDGADKAGWLEDAWYFKQILKRLKHP